MFTVALSPFAWADSELPLLGVDAAVNLQKEAELGRWLYQRLVEAGLTIEDPLLDRYLNDIGVSLLSHLDHRLREYTFFLVRANSINAFAAPGGYIGVHAGLIAQTRSEDELAAVLAHEIAHVELRHSMQMIEHAQGVNNVGMLSILAAILVGTQNPDLARALVITGTAGSGQSMLNFTRANEYEADRVGIELLKKSDYASPAMVDFMRLLQRKEQTGGIGSIEYLRTHPIGANRIAEIESRISRQTVKKTYKSSYERFRDYLFYAYPPARPQGRDSSFAKALLALEQGDNALAVQRLQELAARDTHDLWVQYALANSLELQGELNAANDIYRKMLLLYPQDLAFTLKLVKNLVEMEDSTKALTAIDSLLQRHDDRPEVYEVLVQIHRLRGDLIAEQLAQADYHWYGGNKKRAVQLYEALIDNKKLDLISEQKLRQKVTDYQLKKDGITE